MNHEGGFPADAGRGVRLLQASRRTLLTLGIFGVFGTLLALDPPPGLSLAGWRSICLFVLIVTLWITTLIPLAVTSLVAIAGIPLLDIMPEAQAYAYFGSEVVFFIMGAFILGAALVGSGLSTRLATLALGRFGTSRNRLILTLFLVGAAGSCLISEHAVAAMLFPIAMSISRTLDLRKTSPRFGRLLFSALAWGCIVGGTTTILGGGRGPLAIGILEERTGGTHTIGFVEYIAFDIPLVIILLIFGMFYLRPAQDDSGLEVESALAKLRSNLTTSQGPLTGREMGVGAIMVATVVAWVLFGHDLGLANIAIVSVALLFLLRLMTWRDVEEGVNWGVLLLYGGAICLGSALQQSGATQWLTNPINDGGLSPQALLLAFGFLSMVLTELMSNSAVIAVLLPVALEVGAAYGIDLRVMAMAVVLPSNFAFSFPMATPANALAYSSGFLSIGQMLKRGIVMDLMGYAAFVFLVLVYWPLLGYNLGG